METPTSTTERSPVALAPGFLIVQIPVPQELIDAFEAATGECAFCGDDLFDGICRSCYGSESPVN